MTARSRWRLHETGPARRGRLLGCTVKEISAYSENLNLTDALEQQRPSHPDEEGEGPPVRGRRAACL